ncbi:prolyl hydroxylase family protein [Croceicoccus bisphenolivorans]|uniref:prolyl hydroxylase family protein n=1 Tax=Croceicoccus bisphenolivorans TaxID=1783232 RepID=UPI00082D0C0D|nr:2OG-Fe(II) oxygenase [Croceicoccus bisphenolivorans]
MKDLDEQDFGETVSARLRAWPGMQRVPSPKLELFTLRDFVPAAMRSELMALIDANRRPSTIADPNGDDYFRTSETCDLSPDEPVVQDLRALFTQLSGIDPRHAEPSQGQRYEVGQEFKNHTDYFEPSGADYQKYCSVAGQRTWTFMVYLNEPEAGGATRFKVAGKMFQPEAGRLVCWNNMRADGSPNAATLHHGMKVRKGMKYVITQWYREKEWK